MLMDWMCLTLGRDPEMDAGNYDGEMALCRLGSPAKPKKDGIPSPWEHPGKTPSLEGQCSCPAPVALTKEGGAEGDDSGALTQVGGSQPEDQGQEQVPLTPI